MTHSSSGPGYDKALYYPISEESGGKVLHDIRSRLEAVVPRYLPQSFIPHITVAEIYNGEPQGTAWSFEELNRSQFLVSSLIFRSSEKADWRTYAMRTSDTKLPRVWPQARSEFPSVRRITDRRGKTLLLCQGESSRAHADVVSGTRAS
jgi:hypothetical protein